MAVSTGDEIRFSTASAIDLAGSEDNRRTENGKERMVESASINKSLFTLAKCVEAISTKSSRIPYRESKMTRILSLGQNNGLTLMILNLAPTKSYHLDTISSLNFANRTKGIEVREIENESVFKVCPKVLPSATGPSIQRQPLRSLASAVHNASSLHGHIPAQRAGNKQAKAFSVYADKVRTSIAVGRQDRAELPRRSSPLKRSSTSDPVSLSASRPPKRRSPNRQVTRPHPVMSKQAIEAIIEEKVADILSSRALDQPSLIPVPEISEEVQRRLDMLEKKIDCNQESREQGLTFLLMAKQHAVRGEDASALRMYVLAKEYFPNNEKLDMKIARTREKLQQKRHQVPQEVVSNGVCEIENNNSDFRRERPRYGHDAEETQADAADEQEYESDIGFHYKAKTKKSKSNIIHSVPSTIEREVVQTPRTKQLLEIVNTRDISQIRLLKGVGAKKAGAIVEALRASEDDEGEKGIIQSLEQLGMLRGVGSKTVGNMRMGLTT